MPVFGLHLLALLIPCVSIELKYIVIMFSILMSGMPIKACPLPGTIKHCKFIVNFYVLVLLFTYPIVLLLFSNMF